MWDQTAVTERLGIRYPIIQGPFGGGLSSTVLAAAVANAGGLGSFGAHHLEPDQIKATIAEIRQLTDSPFAINLWVPQPGEREQTVSDSQFARYVALLRPYFDELDLPAPTMPASYSRDYEAQIGAVLEARPPVFSFIFGIPSAEILAACRQRGIRTVGTASNVDEAIALDAAGVDVIVASGSEAGGHRASFLRPAEESPAISALVPQIADRVQTPIVAAGGITDGRGVVAALALGASGVQVGTAFLNCEESGASPAHRAALRAESARYTLLTRVFSGRLARGIRNRFIDEMSPHAAEIPPYPIQNWLTQHIRRAAAKVGQADLLALWAGQNAPLLTQTTADAVMSHLLTDTDRVLANLSRLTR